MMVVQRRIIRIVACAVVGCAGGVVMTHAAPSAFDGPLLGTLAGIAFGLSFWLRSLDPGEGLMWGAAFGVLCWFVSLAAGSSVGFQQLIGDVMCLGIPLGLTLGASSGGPNERVPISIPRAVVGGGLAGIFGGAAFGKWMERAHFFPLIAGIVNSTSKTVGVTLHFGIAVIIGATFGLLFQREIRGLGSSLGWGAAYGLLWWFIGPLTLLPLFSHKPVDWSTAHAAALFGSLVGHIVFGLIVGLIYGFVDRFWQRLFYESDPLNRERAGLGVRTISSVYRGLLASVGGGLAFGIIMITNGTLPRVAALVGSTSLVTGFVVHMIVGSLIGATYGLLFRYEAPDAAASTAWGLLYGLVWWFVGPLTLFPILLRGPFTWTLAAAAEQLPSLVGHLVYGVATALAFLWLERKHRRSIALDQRHAAREFRRVRPAGTAAPAVWLVTVGLGIVLPVLLTS